jgi:two-component system chemotaxis sensor kinase CheA
MPGVQWRGTRSHPTRRVDRSRYADLFLTESREHLSAITQSLLELERTEGGAASVSALFRSVHTIKGMSATMGYTAVAELSHELEALLDRIRGGTQAVTGDVIDLLFSGTDLLETSIEKSVAGREDEVDVSPVIVKLKQLADAAPLPSPSIAVEGIPSALASTPRRLSRPFTLDDRSSASGAAGSASSSGVLRVKVTISASSQLPGVRGFMVVQAMRALGELTELSPAMEVMQSPDFSGTLEFTLRTALDVSAVERAAMLVGEIGSVTVTPALAEPMIASSAERESGRSPTPAIDPRDLGMIAPPLATPGGALPSSSAVSASGAAGTGAPFASPSFTPLGVPVIPAAGSGGSGAGNGSAAAPGEDTGVRRQRHVRIDLRRLDSLMNLIGELVITRGRLNQIAGALHDDSLDETVAQASRLVSDLQDEIMTSRMVPVWQVFDRFPRLVRDAARSLGKQVAFTVEGKEIELDRSMLDEIGDPVVHLLRNAIDHGIEKPEVRVAAGKPAVGRLTLSALRDRSAVIIRVSDDGKGIDRDRVLRRAKEMHVIDSSKTDLSDDELIRLVSRPGFSTAEQVTSISGRGVGVDAVQTRVRSLGGTVDIKTAPGEGTTVTVRLPLTLAIVRALLAKVGDETYALPMTHVNETVELESALLRTVKGREVLVLRDDVLPLIRLRGLLRMPSVSDERRQVVVLEIADRRAGLIVDELTGQQEIVVKQFDGVRDGLPLFSGATILGDGAPALIVDVGSLI